MFHTYAYAIENLQCYAPSLHDTCVAITLNDHRIFDFVDYLRQYSEAIFPLFVWSVWAYRTGNHNKFSLSDFNRVIDPGGFNVLNPSPPSTICAARWAPRYASCSRVSRTTRRTT